LLKPSSGNYKEGRVPLEALEATHVGCKLIKGNDRDWNRLTAESHAHVRERKESENRVSKSRRKGGSMTMRSQGQSLRERNRTTHKSRGRMGDGFSTVEPRRGSQGSVVVASRLPHTPGLAAALSVSSGVVSGRTRRWGRVGRGSEAMGRTPITSNASFPGEGLQAGFPEQEGLVLNNTEPDRRDEGGQQFAEFLNLVFGDWIGLSPWW
jgi:hypothetical protein